MTDIRAKAGKAKHELEVTTEAFAAVRAAMVDKLTGLAPTNTQAMQALVCGIQSLDAVQKAVRAVVDSGRIADAEEEIRPLYAVA